MDRYGRRYVRFFWLAMLLFAASPSCVPLGMSLPYDPAEAPPDPSGGRIKATVGWLSTHNADIGNGTPDGSISIDIVHMGGHTLLQQVRHYRVDQAAYGDSILLDRTTLRPVTTTRWTPRGTYVTTYNHRVVVRVFRPLHGPDRRSTETLDVEPYSALGMELLIASLPLSDGVHGVIPVAVDTAARGWSWLHFEVQRELALQERPDQRQKDMRVVDCDIGTDRTRLWIDMDGRSVRRIEQLGPDNEVLSTVRRMLLGMPHAPTRAGE